LFFVLAEHDQSNRAPTGRIENDVDRMPDLDPAQPHRQPKERFRREALHSLNPCPSPGLETDFSTWRLHFDSDVVDASAGRPAANPRYQCVHRVRRAFERRLDIAFGTVAHPACDATGPRALQRRPPEADALHTAADQHMHALRVSQIRILARPRAARICTEPTG